MTTTEPSILGGRPPGAAPSIPAAPGRAEGLELLGPVTGSGYKAGANLVRRADGQIVQLGPLMYGVLDCADGARMVGELADDLSERLGRKVGPEHVVRLAEKLADLGLLAGSEHLAPPRKNPLLALRWKVLVTNPRWTVRLTNPFRFLFRPWVMWPVLAAFVGVVWFVIVRKGVASATADAFHRPGLLLLVFALGVVSAGFHEWGHAAACRYGGATPGGMGMGVYLVWPAFYTDVTDTYRLPRRARLRVDLAGLYFNAIVAVLTMAVWLFWRVDALLLLVALQVLQMVKQLSPVIRADGYHILSDATGVPDLYSHMGPTLKRLLPGHRRQPSALSGRARLLVTAWVLIIVPVLFGLMLSAVLLLPHLATSAWDSGRYIARAVPHQISNGQVVNLLDSVLELLALVLPVLGSLLVTQKFVRMLVGRARSWSKDSPIRKIAAATAAAGVVALLIWAWWPSGQYQPVRANQNGTISGLVHLVSSPAAAARPAVVAGPTVAPGAHLAVAMIPAGGIGPHTPAVFIIPGTGGRPATELLLGGGQAGPTRTGATAFPFKLPAPPGPGGNQALAVNTTDHGVVYNVAYTVVTVTGGAPVTESNTAYALADCQSCTTVAVSFQVVLVVGSSNVVAPIDAAGALNKSCPACATTAIADQIVVTLDAQPSQQVVDQLNAALSRLNDLAALGANGTPAAIAAQVAAVQSQVDQVLGNSGLVAQPTTSTTLGTALGTASPSGSTSATSTAGSGPATPGSATPVSTTTWPSTTLAGTTGSTTATTSTPSSTTGTTTPSPTTATTSTSGP